MDNTTSNQTSSTLPSATLPNTAGLSITNGVPNTSSMPVNNSDAKAQSETRSPGSNVGSTSDVNTAANVDTKVDAKGDASVDANIDATLDAAKNEKLVNDNKDQLRRRVMQRETDLANALTALDGSTANFERRDALVGALDAVRDVTKAGWEHVGEVEAAQLSRWLETSETLILQGIPAEPMKVADKAADTKTDDDKAVVTSEAQTATTAPTAKA